MTTYLSQCGQDRYLNEVVFLNKRNGTFLDIGANDGKTLSNTYFFEKELNWRGICIEPIPSVFAKLRKERTCICENCCVFSKNEIVQFASVEGYAEMLSGIVGNYDPRHVERIKREVAQHGGKINIINIQGLTLETICEKHKLFSFDFCTIDVEGAELNIIKSMDLSKIDIKYIIAENNYGSPDVEEYLRSKGYNKKTTLETDEVFEKII
jgi:FkbM family methyltransferase